MGRRRSRITSEKISSADVLSGAVLRTTFSSVKGGNDEPLQNARAGGSCVPRRGGSRGAGCRLARLFGGDSESEGKGQRGRSQHGRAGVHLRLGEAGLDRGRYEDLQRRRAQNRRRQADQGDGN